MVKSGAEKEHKPVEKKHEDAPAKAAKGHHVAPGGCHSWGCKAHEKRFSFCEEHFEQFKFGLIKKTGEPVSDYEKKFEHYQAFQARQRAHKVA